jgi:toxin ParE1/3/4
MAKILYSEFARDDLKKVWLHISKQNLTAADKFLDELYEKFLLLAKNPKIGRSHDEFIVHLRSFPHKKYVIFYFPTENGIEVYRILHGARDIEDLFDRYFIGLKP